MRWLTLLAALWVGSTAAAASATPVDCPLRDLPFSLATPFIDILLSPQASAVVDNESPGIIAKIPKQFASAQAPSFAAILTMREAGAFLRLDARKLAAIERNLQKLPVTAADREARCQRYDDDGPISALPSGAPHILLFEKINGFRDEPSVDAARAALMAMAKRKGWAITVSDSGGAITPRNLAQFDIVIWNNVSGDVLTLAQRRAFQRYMARGGGYIGIHGSAGDPATFWNWYVDTLIGARFAGHPIAKQFQDARVVLEGRNVVLARGLPFEWVMKDEWYSFKNNPRATGSTIVATLDEKSYEPIGIGSQDLRMGDHPIAWTRCVGRGRMFYSAIGHRPEVYSDARYVLMLENAVDWASKGREAGCRKGE